MVIVHSSREMCQRVHDAGFTEAAAAMRQGRIPCDVEPWTVFFQTNGDVFVRFFYDSARHVYHASYWEAPRQLVNRPSLEGI